MGRILGTDGIGDAKGKPTIIRDPTQDGKQEERLYITLLSALTFSKGFYLDAAWLVDSPLSTPIKKQDSSLRRLLAKSYIQLISRVPREDMLKFMPEELQIFIKNHRVWTWPTQFSKPRRMENGDWVFVGQSEPVRSLNTVDGKLESTQRSGKHFVNRTLEVDNLPLVFNKMLPNLGGTLHHSELLPFQDESFSREILASTKTRIIELLEGEELCKILKSTDNKSQTRKDFCRIMQKEVASSSSGLSKGSLRTICDSATSTAKLLGFAPCDPNDNDRVSVSLSDIFGFLLCW